MVKIRSGNTRFMKPVNEAISSCRRCQFYGSEGRRGGHCQQLGVPVQGGWKACSLAVAPFASSWKKLSEIATWPSTSDLQAEMKSEMPLTALALVDEAVTQAAILEEIAL